MYRFSQISNVMNMDGIDWKREKWSFPARAWFWFNEWAGARMADPPGCESPRNRAAPRQAYVSKKITVIPYGADSVTSAPSDLIHQYGLNRKGYYPSNRETGARKLYL